MAKKATDEQIEELLGRGVAEVIGREHLVNDLKKGNVLRFKLGMDPTSPDLHLGHAVILRKLRKFQDMGHEAVVIIGDYTARIGDPSGRSKTRPPLEPEAIDENAKTYFAQVAKILNVKKIKLEKNSKWLSKLTFADLIKLAVNFTVARTLERDDFANRYKEGMDIHLHELLYPMMQAFDSVAINASVELGGTDQKFNMLAGRELQKKLGQTEQEVITFPLLVGLDGTHKMSKSLGNYIGITESAESMYGKVMSIPDSLILNWFELATEMPENEIKKVKELLSGGDNPRDIKMLLAREITSLYHSDKEVNDAEDEFVSVVQNKNLPKNIEELVYESPTKDKEHSMPLRNWVKWVFDQSEEKHSMTQCRQLIEEGAVLIDGKKMEEPDEIVTITQKDVLFQKKRFCRRIVVRPHDFN